MLRAKRGRRFAIVLAAAALAAAAVVTAVSIAHSRREKAIDAIVAKLADEKARDKAEEELAAVTDRTGIRRIVWHLGDDDYGVRSEIANVIGRVGAPAVGPVAEATKEYYRGRPRWTYRSNVGRWVYGKWRQMFPQDELVRWSRNARVPLLDAYAAIGAPARGVLIEMLSDPRMRADLPLQALAGMSDPRDLDLFISHTKGHPRPRGSGARRRGAWQSEDGERPEPLAEASGRRGGVGRL